LPPVPSQAPTGPTGSSEWWKLDLMHWMMSMQVAGALDERERTANRQPTAAAPLYGTALALTAL
jgi:hypothetical protein